MLKFLTHPRSHHLLANGEVFPRKRLQQLLADKGEIERIFIKRPTDVLLNKSGRVQRKFKFTRVSLEQFCSVLAPGLGTLVSNLGGLTTQQGSRKAQQEYSTVQAIEILNGVIHMRFASKLAGRYLLVSESDKRIEGIVSSKHVHFENREFLSICDEFVKEYGISSDLCEARLRGRELVLRYKNQQDLFHQRDSAGRLDWLYSGWHFSNNEVRAKALRVGLAIVRVQTNRSALLEVGRLRGRGDIHGRFKDLLIKLYGHAASGVGHNLEDSAAKLMATQLGLGEPEAHHAERFDSLVKSLVRGGLLPCDARRILNYTLMNGSSKGGKEDDFQLMKTYQKRTGYDLFNGLISQSPVYGRLENAERLAYKFITGHFNLR